MTVRYPGRCLWSPLSKRKIPKSIVPVRIDFFFLSGLCWHLPGLSELPLEQRLLLFIAGEYFPFSFFHQFYGNSFLFPIFCFCGPFSCIRECCRRASTARTAQHSTAQSALHKAANQVRADHSATAQASRQNWQEPEYRQKIRQLARRNRNLPRPQKNIPGTRYMYCPYFSITTSTRYMLVPVAIQHCSFSLSFSCISYMHAASGLFHGAWSPWHLQVVSLHLKSWFSLSVSFDFCSILLPCQQA